MNKKGKTSELKLLSELYVNLAQTKTLIKVFILGSNFRVFNFRGPFF